MPDQDSLVSVVLPTYNVEEYLRTAVQSVLDQTYGHWELIVIDDGSTDGTPAYLDSLRDARIRVLKIAHSGNPARVRNEGLAVARGEYVAFLDSDDAWYPEKIEKQIADLRAHPECGWSYTFTCRMGQKPNLSRFRPLRGWIQQELMTLNAFVAMPTVMARRDVLRDVGGFDDAFVFCSDYELWIRLAGVSQVTVVPEALAWVRSHAGSHTSGRLGIWEAWVRLYEKLMLTQADSRVTALARTRRTESLIALASQYTRAGRHRESLGALGRSAVRGIATPRWWVVLAQSVLRKLLPASVLAYRRRLMERGDQPIQADRSRPTSSAVRRISSR